MTATQPLPIVPSHPTSEDRTQGDRGVGDRALGEAPSGRIEVLIGQALDDLDEGRLDVQGALRLIARAAWEDGYSHGGQSQP